RHERNAGPQDLERRCCASVSDDETISRVTGLSLTGRLMRPIADRYFVQWPGAQADAKGSIYAGRLM
ncbi:MAG: hypothetical protein P8N02_08520, partial [Actinomycetota bacterium]|nr:hypothetical protein [Actinomycetota bacterium]